jgi:hypothetical protein
LTDMDGRPLTITFEPAVAHAILRAAEIEGVSPAEWLAGVARAEAAQVEKRRPPTRAEREELSRWVEEQFGPPTPEQRAWIDEVRSFEYTPEERARHDEFLEELRQSSGMA